MERLVATEMTFESPVRVEFDLPQRSSCRIRDKEIASGIKGKAIGDEILRQGFARWLPRTTTCKTPFVPRFPGRTGRYMFNSALVNGT